MIIWQGSGFAGFLFPVIIVFGGQYGVDALMGEGYYSSHHWTTALLLVLSAAAVWFFGSALDKEPGRELIDPKTQQKVLLKEKHTIFWIPLRYFSIVILVFAAYVLLRQR
jgi:hypothetical protein